MEGSNILNNDVLIHLFACLDQSSLLRAILVCKRWREVAQQTLDSTETLALAGIYEERNLRLFRRVESDEAIRNRIKRIVVRDWHHSKLEEILEGGWPWLEGGYFSPSYPGADGEWRQSTKDQLEGLERCLRILRLTSLTWAAIPSFPENLAIVLREKQQDCHVHVLKNELWRDNALWALTPFVNRYALSNLSLLPNLVSLELLIAPPDSALLQKLGTFLAERTKTLRSLRLTAFGRLWRGCKINGSWSHDLLRIGEPRLYLVRNIDWLTQPLRSRGERLKLRDLELTNICICESTQLTGLHHVTDLYQLESLELSCFGLLQRCTPSNFSSLRAISLGSRNGHVVDREKCISDWPSDVVRTFLSYCRGLHQLAVVDCPDILSEDLLETIGSNLTVIDVHQSVSSSTTQRTHVNLNYPIADIVGYPDQLVGVLSTHCKGLKRLSISVGADWPEFNATLDKVAKSFSALQTLNLYRQAEPYSIREGEADSKSFNKWNMLPIWDRYHAHSVRPLSEMALHLQHLVDAERYNPIRQVYRIPTRTYVVNRATDETFDGSRIVRTTMLEFDQAMKEAFEKAPQQRKGPFPSPCRGLKVLCDEGQPLNTGNTQRCYIRHTMRPSPDS